jgi:hypothetical protein
MTETRVHCSKSWKLPFAAWPIVGEQRAFEMLLHHVLSQQYKWL